MIPDFLRDANGRRPVYGGRKKFQEDLHWRDYILVCRVGPEDVLRKPKESIGRVTREQVAGK